MNLEPAKVFALAQHAQTSTEPLTATDILKEFENMWKKAKTDNEKEVLINTKNFMLRSIVSEQMRTQRYFEVKSPFENTCESCKGTGEIYKFQKKTVYVNCHVCGGEKTVTQDCPDCENGRYIRTFPDGGSINVQCRRCQGTTKIQVQCQNCIGKGKVRKVVRSHNIASTTPCEKCHQIGFVEKTNKTKKTKGVIDNPVLTKEQATEILTK